MSLHDVTRQALQLVAGHLSERGVSVVNSENSLMLHGDRARLVEIWQNLVENAVKYMGNQAEPSITLGVELIAGETVFFVRDNGIGIDQKYHHKIFGLFDKLDAGSEGSGLGLALVRRIVELYGGRIWVESEGVGRGSCFCFTLPGALLAQK
jgi:signal transduction histidine kinase